MKPTRRSLIPAVLGLLGVGASAPAESKEEPEVRCFCGKIGRLMLFDIPYDSSTRWAQAIPSCCNGCSAIIHQGLLEARDIGGGEEGTKRFMGWKLQGFFYPQKDSKDSNGKYFNSLPITKKIFWDNYNGPEGLYIKEHREYWTTKTKDTQKG